MLLLNFLAYCFFITDKMQIYAFPSAYFFSISHATLLRRNSAFDTQQ